MSTDTTIRCARCGDEATMECGQCGEAFCAGCLIQMTPDANGWYWCADCLADKSVEAGREYWDDQTSTRADVLAFMVANGDVKAVGQAGEAA